MLAHTDTLAFSRYIMYHHPVFSFVLFTTLFFSFEVFVMASIWLLATLYTSPSISSRIAPSLQVEENWVEGVRRGQGGQEQGETGGETETVTDEGDLTEMEDGAQKRRAGFGDTDTDEQASESELREAGEAPAGSTMGRDASGNGLRRRAFGREDESSTSQRSTSSDPRAAAAAASLRSQDEEERREAERARVRRDAMAGRRMTDITGSDITSPAGSGPSSPAASRDTSGSGQQSGSVVDPFLDILPSGTRRILSRLDEETEEETVSGSTERASSAEDGLSDEEEAAAQVPAQTGGDEKDDESISGQTGTVGGSSTSRATSMAPSFGPSVATSASTASEDVRTPTRQAPPGRSSEASSAEQTPTSEMARRSSAGADSGAEADEEPVTEDE